MSLPSNLLTFGLLTVEPIVTRSWIVRRRLTDASLTARYGWVCNMVETAPAECAIKGYLARNEYQITVSDRRTMGVIGQELGFEVGRYERIDTSGNLRAAIEMWGKSR